MAFEGLTDRLQKAMEKLRRKPKVTEADLRETMREIRLALLEADVNFAVVKDFVKTVREKAAGAEVLKGLNPAQQIVKIVNEELTKLMGEEAVPLNKAPHIPTVIMMVGLQGAGKTTTAGKLALRLKNEENARPMFIAADVYRPAAITQLQQVADQIGVPVFEEGTEKDPVDIVRDGMEQAKQNHNDYVIIDTAGRLQIDEQLMDELVNIKNLTQPNEILLVVDAMTGQDIVNVANTFNDELNVTGLVVTKFDGDSKGGAVLSVKSITGVPIKFVGVGEKISDLDEFHPDRLADRILGMGDVVSLVEKAQEEFDEKRSEEIARNMMSGKFTLDDMLYSIEASRKLGPLSSIMGMLPGMGDYKNMINDEDADKNLKKVKAVIQSMTPEERKDPSRLRGTHKRRIAKGSGTTVDDVNKVINQYDKMKKVMRSFSGMFRNMM